MLTQLAVVLLSAGGAYSVWRLRRLPNWLTLGGAVVALALGLAAHGLGGLWASVTGWFIGLLMLLPLAATGLAAPGDMKLAGAFGALVGWPEIAWIGLFSLGAGIAIAVGTAAAAGSLRRLAHWSVAAVALLHGGADWRQHVKAEARGRVPIALILATGAVLHLLWTNLGAR